MARSRHGREAFEAFVARRRAEQPLPPEMDALARQRGEILADVLSEWLAANQARFVTPQRKGLFGSSPSAPRFLVETDAACLAVLRERGVEAPEGLTLATVEQLQAWRDDHPDAMEALYPVVSSFFTTGLPTSLYRRAMARCFLRPGEQFWIHVRSAWTSPGTGNGSDDLWKSDGETMTLLEPHFTQWRK